MQRTVGWTQNAVVSGQLSKASPALAAFGDRLHMVHLGDSSNRIWHSQFDGSSWSTNVAIPDQLSKASPAMATYGDRCGRERLHITHLGDSSNRIWHSEFDREGWTRNFYLADQLSKAAPALSPFARRLHLVHLGDTSNRIWQTSFDGLAFLVRLGLKVLVEPDRFSLHTMLYEMATVYATADFRVVELGREDLDLTDLEVVDVGDCRGTICAGNGSTEDQATLFANRNGLGSTDVAVYFMDSTVKAFNGCAVHPEDVPGCIVTKGASRWTLGHEVGHVLCLRHIEDSDNLMTDGGTDNLTNPPADLTAEQIATMQDAPYMLPRLGRGKLSAIERNAVQDLVDLLVAEGRAPSTVRNAILPLRAIYRRALERSEVAINPTEGLRLPALRGRRERIARPPDARVLIEALETPDRALWATALYAGLRRGELRALRWEDVDFERGLICVERSWDPVAGPVAPKSHAGRRRVPLARTLRPYLEAHRVLQGRDGHGLCFGALPERSFDPPAGVERAQRGLASRAA